MLDLDDKRQAVTPRDAATLVLVRDGDHDGKKSLEVFCVERHKKSGFMGGAIVFPGGKLDARDLAPEWSELSTAPRTTRTPIANDEATLRGLAIAACRETLEEAAMLPIEGGRLSHDELLALRGKVARGEESLPAFLRARGFKLDLSALHPFARWITPVAESRRFDARFFLTVVGNDVRGAHDEHETTSSFWARPADVLRRFDAGEIQVVPPTHRTIELLSKLGDARAAIAWAKTTCLDPICPELVKHEDTLALALPGDPAHGVKEARVDGKSRFVLRGERWVPEDAPAIVRAAHGTDDP
jgi:8-oxo-dGTP pyrophosphatase MutT (NUDIX family)